MKKLLTVFLLVFASTLMIAADASAARLGGGRSFGRFSPNAARTAPMQRQATTPRSAAKPGTQAAPRRGLLGGLLGGALLGLGLGALLGHFGIGGGMANLISMLLTFGLIYFAVKFLLRMLASRRAAQTGTPAYSAPSGNSHYGTAYQGYPDAHAGSATPAIGSGLGGHPDTEYTPYGVPGDFDVPAFLRSAKTHFIRLQAAWDRADIDDIREFTSPEMFAELRMQLLERGAAPNATDVVTLDAALLGIENVEGGQMASVQFTGSIRENPNAAPEPLLEIWNLVRPLSGSGGWVLAGIQQAS